MSRMSRRRNIRFLIWSVVLLSLLAFLVTSFDVYAGVIKFSNEPIKDQPQPGNGKKKIPVKTEDAKYDNDEDKAIEKPKKVDKAKNGGNDRAKQVSEKAKQASEKAKSNEDAKKKAQKPQSNAKLNNKKPNKAGAKAEDTTGASDKAGVKSENTKAKSKAGTKTDEKPGTKPGAKGVKGRPKANESDKLNQEATGKLEEPENKQGSGDEEPGDTYKKPITKPLDLKNTPNPNTPQQPPSGKNNGPVNTPPKLKNTANDAVNDYINDKYGDHSKDPENPNNYLGDTFKDSSGDAGSIYDDDEEDESEKQLQDFNSNHDENSASGTVDNSAIKPVTIKEKQFADVPAKFDDIQPLSFRVYSHNIKNGGHEILVPGERTWAERANEIANSIAFNARRDSIVTLQEVYKFQLDNLMSELNRYSPPNQPEWAAYGAGRIDGKNIGEFVPVLYKTSEWELVFSDTMWLNHKDPRTSLEGWDAKYLRICSYVTLKHKQTENYINVFNTHFDHVGELSRVGSASMIVQKMNEINKWPSILCGDLNAEPTEKTYELIIKEYKDVSKLTTPFNRYGHGKSSVTGFGGEVLLQGGQNIDYIFAPGYSVKVTQQHYCDKQSKPEDSPEDHLSLKLQAFGMLHSKFNGAYMSDHRPLVADFTLENKCK